VEGVLQGKNGSVFCYGATGAGKTHTMLGTVQNPGVMVLALKDLFAKIKKHSRDGDHVVRLSYLEVYNESVRDLLSPGRPLVLREDSKQVFLGNAMLHILLNHDFLTISSFTSQLFYIADLLEHMNRWKWL